MLVRESKTLQICFPDFITDFPLGSNRRHRGRQKAGEEKGHLPV